MRRTSDAQIDARRRVLSSAALAGMAALLPVSLRALAAPSCAAWPAWTSFVAKHVSEDGRVIDFSMADQRSTSEGQSYGLFFALVNNDQALFERMLGWTRRNLCAGRPGQQLPAWLWGRDGAGKWGVLDDNSASDADLWIAYVLLEAARLWRRPGYARAGLEMLALIRTQEVVELPGLGPMLLPGRTGFAKDARWLLNPSYLPLQLLRRFSLVDPHGPWSRIVPGLTRMLDQSAPVGFAPDWIAWNGQSFAVDATRGNVGSYDAIRVYLWAGMLDEAEPLRAGLLDSLSGPLGYLKSQGAFAEKFDSVRGVGVGTTPAGFSAALLPYLDAAREPALRKTQLQRLPAPASAAAAQLPYYERTLVLFGQGWLDHRYRFSADGRLQPAWRSSTCFAPT